MQRLGQADKTRSHIYPLRSILSFFSVLLLSPFSLLLPHLGVGIDIVISPSPWLSKDLVDGATLDEDEFERRYWRQVEPGGEEEEEREEGEENEEEEEPLPPPEETYCYYQLYSAKHKGEGELTDMITKARGHDVAGEESGETFHYLIGLLLDKFYERGTCRGGREGGRDRNALLVHLHSLTHFPRVLDQI